MHYEVQNKRFPRARWNIMRHFETYGAALRFARSLDQDGCAPDGVTLRVVRVSPPVAPGEPVRIELVLG